MLWHLLPFLRYPCSCFFICISEPSCQNLHPDSLSDVHQSHAVTCLTMHFQFTRTLKCFFLNTMRHKNITYPKNSTRIIFEITVTRFEFFSDLISNNHPIPSVFVWVAWHYPPKTPVLVKLFFIAVTRFEIFRINLVMFSWQMVHWIRLTLSKLYTYTLGFPQN